MQLQTQIYPLATKYKYMAPLIRASISIVKLDVLQELSQNVSTIQSYCILVVIILVMSTNLAVGKRMSIAAADVEN